MAHHTAFTRRRAPLRLSSLALLLAPLSCGTLIGLDEFKSDEDGDGGTGGTSGDTGGTSSGGTISSGGTSSGGTPSEGGAPSGGTGSGGEPPISCTPGEDVIVIDSSATRNGSFEFPVSAAKEKNASVWTETRIDYIESEEPGVGTLVYNCPCDTVNSTETVKTPDHPDAGTWSAWLGNFTDWEDWLSQELTLPENVSTARVRIHTNIQSAESSSAGEADWLYVRLVDADANELATFATRTNQDAQLEQAEVAWTNDGIDETIDVSTWAGQTVYFEIRSTNDYGRATDFLLDDVRLTLGCE